jgi:uncharacterized membrane protein YccC
MSQDAKTSIAPSAEKEAMKTALACSLAIWISYSYAWPEPYWSCTAIVLSRHSDKSVSWLLLSKQSGGVALGTFIGIAMLTLSQSAFLFCRCLRSAPALWLIVAQSIRLLPVTALAGLQPRR